MLKPKNPPRSLVVLVMVFTVALSSRVARAADDKDDEDEPARKPGWTPGLFVGGSVDFTGNDGVVGQADGINLAMGAMVEGELEYNEGIHQWRAALDFGLGANIVPAAGEIEKADDNLDFETLYRAHFVEQAGVFARVSATTTMLASYEFTDKKVTYEITRPDGSVEELRGRRLQLTEPFRPTTFKESVGGFVEPVEDDHLDLYVEGGLGAHETIAAGQLAFKDDPKTATVEVLELQDSFQIGAEGSVTASGDIDNKGIASYEASVNVLVPLAHSDVAPGDDPPIEDLVYVQVKGGLDLEVSDWLSLHYELEVLRQPLVIDTVQVTNVFYLTVDGAWGSKAPVKPKPACACQK
ncbi:MAG: DUF3078 domain-containing protein [Polyangiaceae bacterium]